MQSSMSSINPRYKTAITDLPKRTNNNRKRTITNSETLKTNKPNIPIMNNDEIKLKLESLSEKELQSVYITCLILLYDTLMETNNNKL